MNKEKKYEFYEEPSQKHRENVFNAVRGELALNRKNSKSSFRALAFSSSVAFVVAGLVYFQFMNPLQRADNLEVAISENLLIELASLSPNEVEIVEDLDFMDALDELSPEEIEEIML